MSERIIEILCRRDGITRDEAIKRIKYTVALMDDAGWDSFECEDIMMEELGLEPDYIIDLI